MSKYQRLSQQNLEEIALLKKNGVSNAFIGKFCEQYYGVARSTAYRYVSDNKSWYDEQTRKKQLVRIQTGICNGLTSGEIAREMGQSVAFINKLIVQNGITWCNCK